ncbi:MULTISPECIES: FAD-dependent oxidoreductase [unclassified Microbacterium]|uniref:protoporphyrinogen/coproporphyrinogen oxidase n=1 Tax=unclassified Microbacterium TaxID=2609290 RepID=UPI00214AB3B4|nr:MULTISPECIES: FAD-dependent oxidoreductase [unclassified Microbacterium]MCR2808571.1 FAD-dependent oxidoreductase [Microbacterium sp. zg.B185]WIM18991.1 FAD-dependent oxidoreductase [Microbacterium sp. zg-B185]
MQNEPDAPETLDELAAHAQRTHVVVVGGGIGGLVAALTCAKIGMRVTLVEASARLGGALETTEVGGVPVDLGAEGYATRGGAVQALVRELGLADAIVPAAARAEWIAGVAGGSAPLPAETLLGIPENPWDERVRRIIGWRGTWRAYLDRLAPPLTIGQERSLGRLVRRRMGAAVLEQLVAPLSLGAFAIHPDDIDVQVAAPGLNSALTRTGSLAGAVAQVRAAADRTPDRYEGIDGGMSRLVDALHARLEELGARVVREAPVRALSAADDGRWTVVLESDAEAAGHDVGDGVALAGGVPSGIDPAEAVIVAAGATESHRLLSPVVPSLSPVPGTDLEVVTLVLSDVAETAVKTAVYPAPGSARAAAVSDSTARWEWLRRDADVDARVLKVTFGAPDAAPATAGLGDDAAAALALAEASALLEVPLHAGLLRGSHRARYTQPPPVSALGHREAADAARAAIHAVPGLAIVGAVIAGTGIAQVVPDAIAAAERVRRVALWGGGGGEPA